ncbi:VWA domain-containing protein [Pigmentiphaga aceris]|uniref:VWA domain-containing protein n=1 Tax=Pigmentiphaga aceris TaxID=1940612 RepID=A0A5C0B5T5_9BURK|nr:VWA domain-containing protein [Pigmentiphaga aceris]QEI08211.1 VWA domain-containing protein [Pigmentiphaga aceris]
MNDALNRLPAFSFVWPTMLWLLVFVVLLGTSYVWLDRRRQRVRAHHPALKTVGLGIKPGAPWRRHVAPALFLLALTTLIVAIARPQAVLMLPSRIETVVLALDLSGSMRAEDVAPSRLRAAQQAAKVLLDAQPAGVSVGVVALAGTAAVAQAPSRKKDDVMKAIDRLQPQGGTALGNGLLIAITTLLPKLSADAAKLMNEDNAPKKLAAPASPATPVPGAAPPLGSETPVAPGDYKAGAVVLFSDGESNAGPEAMKAAQLAASNGVRIYTVGVGTTEGVVLKVDGMSARVKLDEKILKAVADTTGAEYFRLEDAAELKKVYQALNARLAFDKRDQVEITALFAALGALLAVCAGMLSMLWFGRVM